MKAESLLREATKYTSRLLRPKENVSAESSVGHAVDAAAQCKITWGAQSQAPLSYGTQNAASPRSPDEDAGAAGLLPRVQDGRKHLILAGGGDRQIADVNLPQHEPKGAPPTVESSPAGPVQIRPRGELSEAFSMV
ncbi:hypothetical protein RJ55_06753 [Drechmeria coniospora]|nr:hypothetical protein RJ55_06753 [Drechmeria coniospora]